MLSICQNDIIPCNRQLFSFAEVGTALFPDEKTKTRITSYYSSSSKFYDIMLSNDTFIHKLVKIKTNMVDELLKKKSKVSLFSCL